MEEETSTAKVRITFDNGDSFIVLTNIRFSVLNVHLCKFCKSSLEQSVSEDRVKKKKKKKKKKGTPDEGQVRLRVKMM